MFEGSAAQKILSVPSAAASGVTLTNQQAAAVSVSELIIVAWMFVEAETVLGSV